jgi:hypothetical protein
MQTKPTPTEGQNSTKLETESALRDAACCASSFMSMATGRNESRIGILDATEGMATGINHGSLSLVLSDSTEGLGQSLRQEPYGTIGSNKRYLPCSGAMERGQEGLGLRDRLWSSHIWGILRCSLVRLVWWKSSNSLHNVEAWHPLPGAPLRFRLRFLATLRL